MIVITDVAKNKLLEALTEEENNSGIRFYIQGGGCSGYKYNLDIYKDKKLSEEENEYIINGIKVIIDVYTEQFVKNTTIDYSMSLNSCGFTFKNPNANKNCRLWSKF